MKSVIYGLAAGAVIYEIAALRNKPEGDTISEIIWDLSEQFPVIPFASGVLMGHFFWQRKRR